MSLDLEQNDVDLDGIEDEIVDIDLDIDCKPMPAKNDKIALVDADTIAYNACLGTEVAGEVMAEDFHTPEEWQALKLDKQFIEEDMIQWTCDMTNAMEKADAKIQRILDKTGCQKVELHFSGGRENFRYKVDSQYKANRTQRTPAGLSELKQLLADKYNGTIHTGWEADDIVVYLKTKYPDMYTLCAIDKDVLNTIAGKHFNYYERAQSTTRHGVELKEINMKWVEIDAYTSLTWRFVQTLTGDKTDGIIGLSGIGPAKAQKALLNCMSQKQLWQAVVKEYLKKGRTEEEALKNLNLVDMRLLHQVGDDLVIKLRTLEEMNRG